MSDTVQTKTRDRCAVTDCARTHRQARARRTRWAVISGMVYASDRQCFVWHSWADACPEHAEVVAAAVAGDIEEWAERWRVQACTVDWNDHDSGDLVTTASGDGTPPEWSLF